MGGSLIEQPKQVGPVAATGGLAQGGFNPQEYISKILNNPNAKPSDILGAMNFQNYYDQQGQEFLGMGKGTLQGLQGLAGLAGTIGSMYYQGKQNDRADDVLNMQKQDRTNQYASNKKWNEGIAASGLGTATRAVQ